MSRPRSRRRMRRSAGVMAAALVAAACGSTVQYTDQVAVGGTGATGAAGDELSLPAAGSNSPGATDGTGATTSGSGGGGSGGSGGAGPTAVPGAGSTGGGGGPGGTGQVGQGVTDDTILIGRVVIDNAAAATAALGITVPPVDTEALDRIMVDHVNASGGIGGRRLELVYYRNDANDGRSLDVKDQEACTLWTQDRPVLAGLNAGSDTLKACLAGRGVPQIYENVFSDADDRTFQEFPTYFALNAPELGATARALANGLVEEGFFAPAGDQLAPCPRPVCTGVITFDTEPRRRAVEGVLRPTLEAAGQSLDEVAYVKYPVTSAELAEAAASFPGIVLRFKSRGVNRVLIYSDEGGGLAIFFPRTAATQNYHPRYALTSASAPQALVDAGVVDPAELRGAIAVGWNPMGDLREQDAVPGPGFEPCIALMEADGANPRNSINDLVISLKTCDGFNFLAAALRAGLPDITAASAVAGAEAQSAFPTALSYATTIAPGRHSGTSAVRHSAFDESCTCFRYVSDLRPV
ncbi:MAG: hypothetical protein ACRD0U_21420 [Acidimicrobiales bacterium]